MLFRSCSHAFYWLTLAGGTHALFIKLFYHIWGYGSSIFPGFSGLFRNINGQICVQKRGITVTFVYLNLGPKCPHPFLHSSGLKGLTILIGNLDFHTITSNPTAIPVPVPAGHPQAPFVWTGQTRKAESGTAPAADQKFGCMTNFGDSQDHAAISSL